MREVAIGNHATILPSDGVAINVTNQKVLSFTCIEHLRNSSTSSDSIGDPQYRHGEGRLFKHIGCE